MLEIVENDLIIKKCKKCKKCRATVQVLDDCNCPCGFECCGEKMETVIPNSVDASAEKHVPTYERDGDYINVKVNHVMEKNHYIERISLVMEHEQFTLKLGPNFPPAEAKFPYISGPTIYEYCSQHGLWKKDVE